MLLKENIFWTAAQTAEFLGVELHHVYYLLVMSCIEAVRVGRVWRILPESVKEYHQKKVA